MDYNKTYFQKIEMYHQTCQSNTTTAVEDTFSAYANSFDLSLLPNDTELTHNSQIALSSTPQPVSLPSIAFSCTSSDEGLSSTVKHPPNIGFDQVTNNMRHDNNQIVGRIKIELSSGDDVAASTSKAPFLISTAAHQHTQSKFLDQLKYGYKSYLSPQSSPPTRDPLQGNSQQQTTIASIFYPPSPCPSVDVISPFSNQQKIKQEHHILPPSPPESSCGAPSPNSFVDIKQEPDESLFDVKSLMEKSVTYQSQQNVADDFKPLINGQTNIYPYQDHQLLRGYLEDTTFQKKHNLRPLNLDSLVSGLDIRHDIEPVISLALEHAKREAEETCAKLQITADPRKWTSSQVHAWLHFTTDQFKFRPIKNLEQKFPEDGSILATLSEEEFIRRAPEAGSTIHAQLEIWKLACGSSQTPNFNRSTENMESISSGSSANSHSPVAKMWSVDYTQTMTASDDEDDEMSTPDTIHHAALIETAHKNSEASLTNVSTKSSIGRIGGSHIHLWQFLKELLSMPHINGTAIRWIDRSKGVFKIEDSVRVAKLWGRRKNRPAMNYDKLSRSIRQYYKKGIMKKTERSQRLVYQFCHPYSL